MNRERREILQERRTILACCQILDILRYDEISDGRMVYDSLFADIKSYIITKRLYNQGLGSSGLWWSRTIGE